MTRIPDPADPVLRLELERDPLLAQWWAEFCRRSLAQGLDPNRRPAYMGSFRAFANGQIDPFLREVADFQYMTWRQSGPSELAIRAGERRGTSERVERGWGTALDLLDQVISFAEEFGMVHAHRLRVERDPSLRAHALLLHLHARGVQVAEEILLLLKSGFAAGAEGRWRTLHETAVVAAFIAKHGVRAVDLYLEHDHIRIKRAMESEQEHHRALRIEPYTDDEMAEARARYKDLKSKYGPVFLGDYGWAAEALGRGRDAKSPTFLDVEASLALGPYRPAYRSASDAIHANLGALVDNPGQVAGRTPVFLTRGTEYGLLEPGVRTAGSLVILAHALLTWRPWPLDRVALAAMERMVGDVIALFVECDRRMPNARDGEPSAPPP